MNGAKNLAMQPQLRGRTKAWKIGRPLLAQPLPGHPLLQVSGERPRRHKRLPDWARQVLPASLLVALAAAGTCVRAADVGLAGVFPGKALLTIDGGPPRTVAVGAQTAEGVRVVAVDAETATIEADGKRRTLRVGQNVAAQPTSSGGEKAVLTADNAGHFAVIGSINGTTVRFLVDTGATMVSLGASDARRIGLDPKKGVPGFVQTANGIAAVSRIKLDTVRVGEISLHSVDGLVHQHEIPVALLGMSFLNRVEMLRDGQTMTLKRRF